MTDMADRKEMTDATRGESAQMCHSKRKKENVIKRRGRFPARVDHGGTQLIIAGNFSHGKNVFRSKEISDDTSQSTQGGRRKVGRDTGTKVSRFVIE